MKRGFTLIELLVVVAIIAVLVAILLPSLSNARKQAKRTACLSNLRQLGLSLRIYNDEYGGYLPPVQWQPSGGSYWYMNQWISNIHPQPGGDFGNYMVWPKFLFVAQTIKTDKVFYCPEVSPAGSAYKSYAVPQLTWTEKNIAESNPYLRVGLDRPNLLPYPAQMAMLTDATNYWTHHGLSAYNHYNGRSSCNPNENMVTTTENVFQRHGDGINVVMFDGHAEAVTAKRGSTPLATDPNGDRKLWGDNLN